MHFKKNRRGYICGSYNKHGSKACSDHHLLEDNLVSDILCDIKKLLADVNEQNLLSKLETKMKKQFVQLEKEQKSINQQIINIEKQKTKLIQLLASDVITQQEYRDVVNQNDVRLNQLLKTKLEIDKKLSKTDNQEQIKKLKIELSKFAQIDVLTPDLLHRIIERIEIKADGTARIFYRFSLPSAIV